MLNADSQTNKTPHTLAWSASETSYSSFVMFIKI